jgi:hypothetical protein
MTKEGDIKMSERMRKILIVLSLALILAISLVSLGIAYAGGVRGIGLLGVWFFVTCGIVVVLAQLIPAGILFSSLIATAISLLRKGEMPIRAT